VAWMAGEPAAAADIGATPWRVPLRTSAGRLEADEPALAGCLREAIADATPPAVDPGLALSLGGADGRGLRAIAGRQADASLLEALARLYAEGHKPDLRPLCQPGVRRVPLPGYPFERKTFVFDAPADGSGEDAGAFTAAQAGAAAESAAPVPGFSDGPDPLGNALLDELRRMGWPQELAEELP